MLLVLLMLWARTALPQGCHRPGLLCSREDCIHMLPLFDVNARACLPRTKLLFGA